MLGKGQNKSTKTMKLRDSTKFTLNVLRAAFLCVAIMAQFYRELWGAIVCLWVVAALAQGQIAIESLPEDKP